MNATVDVFCSAKNAGKQFAATIDSVLSQTFRDFRLIIFDDGSDDAFTTRVAKETTARDDRVMVHRNTLSLGLTANLVRGVNDSNAEFIARIDAGDLWLPEKLERQLAVAREDGNIVVLGTQCKYISAGGEVLGRSYFAEKDVDIRETFRNGKGVFTHSSILFRRILNYRSEFLYSQDLDLYLRASELGRLRCLPESLTLCLIDPDGLTLKRKYLQRKFQSLAYRSHFARARGEGDIELRVRDTQLERLCWNLAIPFYRRYMQARTNQRSPLIWGLYLALALLLFPPLLADYVRRL